MKTINKIKIAIIISCCSSFSFGQIIIKGNVKDSISNLNIAYANLGIKNKSVGTITNKDGDFVLKMNKTENIKDSITISHLGYKSYSTSVEDFIKTSYHIINLSSVSQKLDEVILTSSKSKKIVQNKIGRTSKGLGLMHFNFYTAQEEDVDDRLGKEAGMRMKIKEDTYIDALSFNVTSNQFKKIIFRINFYDVKKNQPNKLLNKKDMIFSIEDNFSGWHVVNLEAYDLFFEKEIEEVIVTIQWLESEKSNEKSKFLSISHAQGSSKNFFFREKGMDKWVNNKAKLSFYLNTRIEK